MFVALVVLFAPTAALSGEAFAAVPVDHSQMMQSGHCKMPATSSGKHDKGAATGCCVAMCTALAIAPSVPLAEKTVKRALATFAVATFHVNSPIELATPPPKLS